MAKFFGKEADELELNEDELLGVTGGVGIFDNPDSALPKGEGEHKRGKNHMLDIDLEKKKPADLSKLAESYRRV